MKKKIVLPFALVLSISPIMTSAACSNKWEFIGDDGSQVLLDLPTLKFKELDDFSGKLDRITIDQLFNNFINNNEIKKEQFVEFTKRLQLSVLKSKKNDPIFKKSYDNMMTNLNTYIEGTLHKQWGNNKTKEEAKEYKKWGGAEGFKDHLLLDNSTPNNVYETFRKKFINDFQIDYDRYSMEQIKRIANDLIKKINSDGDNFKIDLWYGSKTETETRNRALRKAYELNDNNELKEKIKSLFNTFAIKPENLVKFDESNKVMMNPDAQQSNKLSKEQKFIAEQWYFNLKPLLVSQINFKYDGKDKNGLEDGIEAKDFDENKNLKNINDFLSDAKSKSFEQLAGLYSDDNKTTFGQLPNLLTLDSSNDKFSPIFKAATYDLAYDGTDGGSIPTDFNALLKDLNDERKDSNKNIIFKKIKIGTDKVVFIADTNEVRFIKINGYDKLRKGYDADGDIGENQESDGKYPAITSDENMRLAKNPYLQYLFDEFKKRVDDNPQSESSGFNPLNEIKNYTDFSQNNIDNNENWWFWFWDMMAWLERDDDKPNNEWYKEYIEFDQDKWSAILGKIFKTSRSSLLGTKINILSKNLNDENDAINKIHNKNQTIVALIDVNTVINDNFMNNKDNLWTIKAITPPTPIKPKNNHSSKGNLYSSTEISNYWLALEKEKH